MKRKDDFFMKRMMNMFLALCMCVSTLMMNGLTTVSEVVKLVNIPPNVSATTERTTVSGSVNALKDENADTQWQTSSWPSQAVIQLDGGHMVKKVVVKKVAAKPVAKKACAKKPCAKKACAKKK